MSADNVGAVLDAAADYIAQPGKWVRGQFVRNDCRCALGAITWAVEPADRDGDPMYYALSTAAANYLADYLVTELGATRCTFGNDEDGPVQTDALETVGGWNDEHNGPLPVVAALRGAAAQWREQQQVAA